MRREQRINDHGYIYLHHTPDYDHELPRFTSYAARDAAIQRYKDLHSEGLTLRGVGQEQRGTKMGYCVMGMLIAEFRGLVNFNDGGTSALVCANNQGPDSYGSGKPVTAKGFTEVIDLLQRCTVG